MPEITPIKAQTIMTALKGFDKNYWGANPIEWRANIFTNAYGEIIVLFNDFNYKTVGKIINENRFQIGIIQFDF